MVITILWTSLLPPTFNVRIRIRINRLSVSNIHTYKHSLVKVGRVRFYIANHAWIFISKSLSKKVRFTLCPSPSYQTFLSFSVSLTLLPFFSVIYMRLLWSSFNYYCYYVFFGPKIIQCRKAEKKVTQRNIQRNGIKQKEKRSNKKKTAVPCHIVLPFIWFGSFLPYGRTMHDI